MSQVAPAERSLVDDDSGHVVAQLDRQIEAGVGRQFWRRSRTARTADFPTLGVKRAHRAASQERSRRSA